MPPLLFVLTAIGRAKRPTVMLVLFTWGFGRAWYWLRVKPRLRR